MEDSQRPETTQSIAASITAGQPSHFQDGRASNHVYFAALLEPAIWGAELATALTGSDRRGHVYVVEPTGPFEDDPNVTNKRFAGKGRYNHASSRAASSRSRIPT